MPFEFLMLQMIPYLFVGIPVWRILRQVEDVQSVLAVDESIGLFGHVRRCLIHDNNQVSPLVMLQHLGKELDHLLGSDAFLMEPEDKLSSTGNGRHCGNAAALARNSLLWGLAARSPGLSEQRSERNVRLVLKVQNSLVFSHSARILGTSLRLHS